MAFIISLIIAYLLGSITTSVLVAKSLNIADPRSKGSGNAGTTNMLRVGGKKAALLVLIGDVLKGIIAVLIGILFHQTGPALALVALAAVVGHIFPVFFGFKGGKGVATSAGALLILSFWVTVFLLVIWAVIMVVTRYVSLASIIAAIGAPILMLVSGHASYAFPVFLIAMLIVWKHRENIGRLRQGTENKTNFK